MTENSNTPADGDAKVSSSVQDLPDTVANIVESMRRGRLSRLVVSQGDFHLELEASASVPERQRASVNATEETEPVETEESPGSAHIITSPMIGTFYSAPAPGEPPFVRVGESISQGDTIGIVEAMKIMNEISADRAGTVVRLVALNGETVEYGSPLIEIDPGD